MTTRNTAGKATEADAGTTTEGTDLELSFAGELDAMLSQAARRQVWFISNPTEGTDVPDDAIVHRGYPVQIAGQVVAIEKAATRFGPMPVYLLDVGKGDGFPLVRFGLTSTVLRAAHERHGVQVGDTIAAHCAGKRKGREQEYEDWQMVVRKAAPTAAESPF